MATTLMCLCTQSLVAIQSVMLCDVAAMHSFSEADHLLQVDLDAQDQPILVY